MHVDLEETGFRRQSQRPALALLPEALVCGTDRIDVAFFSSLSIRSRLGRGSEQFVDSINQMVFRPIRLALEFLLAPVVPETNDSLVLNERCINDHASAMSFDSSSASSLRIIDRRWWSSILAEISPAGPCFGASADFQTSGLPSRLLRLGLHERRNQEASLTNQ